MKAVAFSVMSELRFDWLEREKLHVPESQLGYNVKQINYMIRWGPTGALNWTGLETPNLDYKK